MANVKRQDIYFYVAIGILIALVAVSIWTRVRPPAPEIRGIVQAVQLVLVGAFIVLFLVSLRQPLHKWNRSLFEERQELARRKRRKKSHRA